MNTDILEYRCPNCGASVPTDVKICPNCGSNLNAPSTKAAQSTVSAEAASNSLTGFVLREMKKGTDDISITQKLIEMGMDQSKASQFVQQVHSEAMKAAEEERITAASYAPALVGAVLASLIGGAIWGLIAIVTNHEIGYLAWGMGWLAGFAVVKLSRGKKGVPFQIIAVLSSLLGITLGKYITFVHFLKAEVLKEYGADAASQVTLLSLRIFSVFLDNITSMLNGYDALWVVLAIVTAWRIPRGMGIKKQADSASQQWA